MVYRRCVYEPLLAHGIHSGTNRLAKFLTETHNIVYHIDVFTDACGQMGLLVVIMIYMVFQVDTCFIRARWCVCVCTGSREIHLHSPSPRPPHLYPHGPIPQLCRDGLTTVATVTV